MTQIKRIYTYTLLTALLLLAAGCASDADRDGMGTDALVEVDFVLPGVEQSTPGTATRSVSKLPQGKTVRILPYDTERGVYLASSTYYVTDANGTLAPCTVDGNGSFTAAADTKMKLRLNASYNFYAYSPAVALTNTTNVATVTNNQDLATSYIAGQVIPTTAKINLNALSHLCAQLNVVVKSTDATITKLAKANGWVRLNKLPDNVSNQSPTTPIAIGTGFGQSFTIGNADITETTATVLTCAPTYVLPGVKTIDIYANINVTVQGATHLVTYYAPVTFTENLKPGYAYTLTLTVSPENAEVYPKVEITDWVDGGSVNPGPGTDQNPRYPYIDTNADGKKSIIVMKDVFGQPSASDMASLGLFFHEPWMQTPTHSYNGMGDNNWALSVSTRLEVAPRYASAQTAAWGSTNANCIQPWRRPTIMEMNYITILTDKKMLILDEPATTAFWAATEFSDTQAWDSDKVSNKTELKLTRCVRDL